LLSVTISYGVSNKKNLPFPRTLLIIPTSFDKDQLVANHKSFMTSMNIPVNEKYDDLPTLYR